MKSPTDPRTKAVFVAILVVNLLMQPLWVTPAAKVLHGPLSSSISDDGEFKKTTPPTEKVDPVQQAQLGETYGKLPLRFEQNQGQVDGDVKFLSRGSGYALFLTTTEAVLSLSSPSPETEDRSARINPQESLSARSAVLRMKLIGANPSPDVAGLEESAGKTNYFIGSDPALWRTNVSGFTKVQYREVYPGIDLVYYGNQRQLEYDWIVAPDADPGAIRFALEGAQRTNIDSNGDLVLTTAAGLVRLHKPVVYQEIAGVRHEVAGAFEPRRKQEFGFTLADYDRSKPLVIDPVVIYSTYLGGRSADSGNAIAVDSLGNAYVTGSTESIDFPRAGLRPSVLLGNSDVFVTKFNASGNALVYSTYLGGSGRDDGKGIAVDSAGNAYVTGETESLGFPTVNPYQRGIGGGGGWSDAFVTKFSSTGNALVYSTYLGGSDDEWGNAIAVDSFGFTYVTGISMSYDFPTAYPFQAAKDFESDAFVTKFYPAGNALLYSTYLGGDDNDWARGIAVDSGGTAYVTGSTQSRHRFPTINAIQPSTGGIYGGYEDAFVAKFLATGALFYSTFLGGSFSDWGLAIAVDSSGSAYVTGQTCSINFPTANAFQPANADPNTNPIAPCGAGNDRGEAFVTKFNPSGNALVYSTYLGGNGHEYGTGIAVDYWGNVYVTGQTDSRNFPLANALQRTRGGPDGIPDAFVTKLDDTGSSLVYSTYLGGMESDEATAITVGSSGAYVAGFTYSWNFSTANPFQSGLASDNNRDAFVIKILDPMIHVSPALVSPGGSVTASWAIANPTANDWIGLYATSTAPNSGYISYLYTNGLQSGNLPFAIPALCPPGTTYELRLFNGTTRVATSKSFTIHTTTLSASPTTVWRGQSLTAAWANLPSPAANDWIGLYASSTAGNGAYLRWQYTNGEAGGSMPFTIPSNAAYGTAYELRLFSNGTRMATSNRFTVNTTTLSVSPTVVLPGMLVMAAWANIPNPTTRDWIGLYASSAAPNSPSIAWMYITGQASGSFPFQIPVGTPPGTTYELRLFSNNGYTRLATSNSFTVQTLP